jgi:hypothetical protein
VSAGPAVVRTGSGRAAAEARAAMSARSGEATAATAVSAVTGSAGAAGSAVTTHGVIAADGGGVQGQHAREGVSAAAVCSAAGTAGTALCCGRTMACCTTHSCRAADTAGAAGRMERSACPAIAGIATTTARSPSKGGPGPARASKATFAAAAAVGGIECDAGAVVLDNTAVEIETASGRAAA